MKTEKEVREMYSFVDFFNDGIFMNQDYRQGIKDALAYVIYSNERLERLKLKLKELEGGEDD